MGIDFDDLTLERLMKERLWSFGKQGSEGTFASEMAFESGGWLKGFSHDSEQTWRVKAGAVEFLNKNALVTARFDVLHSADGTMELTGRLRVPGDHDIYTLNEVEKLDRPKHRTALIVPIHDAHFLYGINLLFQSIGSDYDLIFVFSTDLDRRQFKEMHQASPSLDYYSIVLDDYFSGSAIAAISERRVWPSLKKFLALSLSYQHYDYLLCVDAETFIINTQGWTAACEAIIEHRRWYAGILGEHNKTERLIMNSSAVLLAPEKDLEKIQEISGNWGVYSWWWDLPVYSSQTVPGFLEWIGWERSLQFIERLTQGIFDHITYQYYMALYEGFSFVKVNGIMHTMEFCGASKFRDVHQQIHPIRWTNALAYAQDPEFFRQNNYLAFYHIDRKSFPAHNPD